jgi:hypothetical protein
MVDENNISPLLQMIADGTFKKIDRPFIDWMEYQDFTVLSLRDKINLEWSW